MITRLLYFLLLLWLPLNGATPRYQLSICTIFFNEADYLREWIEFHLLVGVEHFYLYNNNSTDHYLEVLSPYLEKGIVEMTDWPSPPDRNWTYWQRMANNHCVKRCLKETAWLAFIDTDEYILPLDRASLPELLKEFEPYGGVKVFWQNYGTSFLASLPHGKLMTESLTWKYPWNHKKNQSGKTIAQPKWIKRCWIHDMDYKKGRYAVTPNKEKTVRPTPQIDRIRINHYWTRAEDFFYQTKIPRMERATGKIVSSVEIEEILRESNQVEDQAIFPWVQALRERMGFRF